MDTRNKQHRWLLHLLGAAILLLGLAACGSSEGPSEDEPNKPKPEVPVDDGDWQTVSATGGTIEKDDITIVFPSGTFSKDTKVAVTEVQSSTVTNYGAISKFYQIMLPLQGTAKDFSITFSSTEKVDYAEIVLQCPGWDRHTGETSNMEISLDTKKTNEKYTAVIPKVDDATDIDTQPYFTVGLIQKVNPESINGARSLTRGTSDYKFKVVWHSDVDVHVDLLGSPGVEEVTKLFERKRVLNEFIETYVAKEAETLKGIGFEMPKSTVTYQLENFSLLERDTWGCYQNSLWWTTLGYVRLNYKKFEDYYNNGSKNKDALECRQTLIHESLHAITDMVYDNRKPPVKVICGLKGDEWAMFDEAVGGWTETLTGKKELNPDCKRTFGAKFMRMFFPYKPSYMECRNTGYGMALFLKYLSKKTSANNMVEFYEEFRSKKPTLLKNYTDFFTRHKLGDFDTVYDEFVTSVVEGKDYDDFDYRSLNETQLIKTDKPVTLNGDLNGSKQIYNYGILCNSAKYDNAQVKANNDKSIKVTQNVDGLTTNVYLNGQSFRIMGKASKGNDLYISMKDLENIGAPYHLVFATKRTKFTNALDSIASELTVEIADPERSASVSPTELKFPAEGGTQTVTVTAKGYKKYNHIIDDEYKSWLSGKNNSAGKLDITAQPNTTGKERVGYVKPYVLIDENSTERVYLTPVKVTQAANEKQGDDTQSEFKIVSGAIHMYYAVAWRHDMSFKAGDEFSTITPKGKGANVKFVQSGRDTGANATWKITVTFDVDDLSLVNVQKAKLSNFKFVYERVQGEYSYYSGHVDYGREDATMESKVSKSQNANGIWYFEAGDLTYHQESMLHYDAWKKDYYSKPEEHTDRSETDVVTDGSYVNISLNVEKKK